MGELDGTVPFVFFYNTTLPFEDLLWYVCDELDLQVKGQGQLGKIQAAQQFLLAQLRQGSTVALLIDEAQNLRDDVFENIRLLSNLETPREKLLQIVLSGQPELEIKLDRPELRQVKQRITLKWRLEGLREDEIGAFIECRLKAIDYGRNDLFPRDAIREIALYSKEVPRLVNIICDNALLIAYADSEKRVSADVIKEVAREMHLGLPGRDRMVPVPVAHIRPSGLEHHIDSRRTHADMASPAVTARFVEEANTGEINPTASIDSGITKPAKDPTPQLLDVVAKPLTNAIGPMAPIVIRSHLTALDDRLESPPVARIAKIVELVSPEILDDVLRAKFQQKMVAVFGPANKNGQAVNAI